MTVVSDFTALLYDEGYRWNAFTDPGSPVILTYSFTEAGDIPTFATDNPVAGTGYTVLGSGIRDQVRAALAYAETAMGVQFVEVASDGMIGFHGVTGTNTSWAFAPSVSEDFASFSSRVILSTDFAPSSYEPGGGMYEVILHEIGHALGLKHPFEGLVTLVPAFDNTDYTVMSYNDAGATKSAYQSLDLDALDWLYGAAFDPASLGWSFGFDGLGRFVLTGGPGDDTLIGVNGPNVIAGGEGSDRLFGRDSDDRLTGGPGLDLLRGADGADTLFGGFSDDTLLAGRGADIVMGGVGSDSLDGGQGDDLIVGGPGADSLFGDFGSDTLFGGAGDDTLDGGVNDDVLDAGAGDDTILSGEFGGASLARPGDGNDTVRMAFGTIVIGQGEGIDTLDNPTAPDATMNAAVMGYDWIVADVAIAGQDITITSIDGAEIHILRGAQPLGQGHYIWGNFSPVGEPAELPGNAAYVFRGDYAGGFNGSDGGEHVGGGAAAQSLNGNGGDDHILGRGGADTLNGGDGDDVLIGGEGGDSLIGGLGTDIAAYTGSATRVVIDLGTGAFLYGDAAGDTASGIEGVAGTAFADKLYAAAAGSVLFGAGGDDRLIGRAGDDRANGGTGRDVIKTAGGADTVDGGAGDDVILSGDGDDVIHGREGADVIKTGLGNDTVFGGDGDDIVFSWRGDDTIYGGAGNDVLRGDLDDDVIEGGPGDDRLIGAPGRDRYLFSDGFGEDRVLDFTNGSDLLDFSGHSSVFGMEDLAISQSATNVVVRDNAGGRIVLASTALADIGAEDFVF